MYISARAFKRMFTCKVWLRYSRERALQSLPYADEQRRLGCLHVRTWRRGNRSAHAAPGLSLWSSDVALRLLRGATGFKACCVPGEHGFSFSVATSLGEILIFDRVSRYRPFLVLGSLEDRCWLRQPHTVFQWIPSYLLAS